MDNKKLLNPFFTDLRSAIVYNTTLSEKYDTLFDFNKELNLNLPTEEFDTIGGFLFDLFGKIPKKNDSIEYENKFEGGGLSYMVFDPKKIRIKSVKEIDA